MPLPLGQTATYPIFEIIHRSIFHLLYHHHHHHHNCFMALFLGPPWWTGARRELLDFMVQGNIYRGRHTDHPAGATPSGLTSAHLHHLPNRPDALLLPNQQCQSTEGNKHLLYKYF